MDLLWNPHGLIGPLVLLVNGSLAWLVYRSRPAALQNRVLAALHLRDG